MFCNNVFVDTILSALDNNLKRFWEVEHIASNKYSLYTPEELQCEEHFIKNKKLINGRFSISLPWKLPQSKLGSSREQALRRFYEVERKLQKDPLLKTHYVSFIHEYLHLKHMNLRNDQNCDDSYFLPHHAVLKEASITTNMRVVFDASAKTTSNYLLNDCLMVEATVQDDLFSILLKFRTFNIVLTADITKMYRQI